MLRLSAEAKVGLFVLLGLGLLVYMSLRVGGISFGKADGYELTVRFESAAGLDRDASVGIAGVEVGRVKDISLDGQKAKVVLVIKPEFKVGKDYVAVLTTKGLLGERYIELIPGSPDAPVIEPGGEITRTTKYTDIDRLITMLSDVASDIKRVSGSFGDVLGGEEGRRTIRSIVNNIDEFTGRLNAVVASNEERFSSTMNSFNSLAYTLQEEIPKILEDVSSVAMNLNTIVTENEEDLREGISNLKAASRKLEETMDTINTMVKEVEPRIKKSLTAISSVANKIDKGEGTIAKLVNDPETHDNINKAFAGVNDYLDKFNSFKVYLGYRAEYLTDAEETKNYLSLRLQPRTDKYYLLEIVDDPMGKKSVETRDVTTAGVTTTTKEVLTSDELKFSLQMAKMFEDLTLRGGIIESTGGVGMDYYLFDGMFKLTLEAFDFDKERNPHLKAGITFNLGRYFFVTGGYDDFISKVDLESYYVGGGFRFEDDDIKYLMGSIPVPR